MSTNLTVHIIDGMTQKFSNPLNMYSISLFGEGISINQSRQSILQNGSLKTRVETAAKNFFRTYHSSSKVSELNVAILGFKPISGFVGDLKFALCL